MKCESFGIFFATRFENRWFGKNQCVSFPVYYFGTKWSKLFYSNPSSVSWWPVATPFIHNPQQRSSRKLQAFVLEAASNCAPIACSGVTRTTQPRLQAKTMTVCDICFGKSDSEFPHYKFCSKYRDFPQACPVCCETVAEHLLCAMHAWGGSCACSACHACVRQWIDEQLPKCQGDKMLRVTCIGCRKFLPQKLVLAISQSATNLVRQLDLRKALEANTLYPACMQVECPRPECVGIGFLGFKTIMCFVCEHQWPVNGTVPADEPLLGPLAGGYTCGDKVIAQFDKTARNITFGTPGIVIGPSRGTSADKECRVCVDFGAGRGLLNVLVANQILPARNLWADDGVGAALASGGTLVMKALADGSEFVDIKSCPNCMMGIEKTGGCDHMTCASCSYQFYWSTLKKY